MKRRVQQKLFAEPASRMCILACLLFAGGGKGSSLAQAPAQLQNMENKDAQILIQPEIGPYFYQQTVFYDGLAEERSMVKDKLAKAKTGQDKLEAVTLDGLLKKKEEVLSDLKTHLEKISGKEFRWRTDSPIGNHSGPHRIPATFPRT